MLHRDKKGVSEMVGYVLLIVIAIGLSVGVYSFLKFYVPEEQANCPSDVAISVEEVKCTESGLQVKLRNRGLFSIDGAYVRLGEVGRVYKPLVSNTTVFPDFYPDGLPPGETTPYYVYSHKSGLGDKEMEIEPIIYVDNELVTCAEATVVQTISCEEGIQDAGRPSIFISTPDPTIYEDNVAEPDLSYDIENSDDCSYMLKVVGQADNTPVVLDCSATNVNLPDLAPADYSLTVSAKNTTSGEEIEREVVYTIAAAIVEENPIITITNPTQGQTFEDPDVPVRITADGNGGLIYVVWYEIRDGSGNKISSRTLPIDPNQNYVTLDNIFSFENGQYTFNVWTNNTYASGNNYTDSDSVAFTVNVPSGGDSGSSTGGSTGHGGSLFNEVGWLYNVS